MLFLLSVRQKLMFDSYARHKQVIYCSACDSLWAVMSEQISNYFYQIQKKKKKLFFSNQIKTI